MEQETPEEARARKSGRVVMIILLIISLFILDRCEKKRAAISLEIEEHPVYAIGVVTKTTLGHSRTAYYTYYFKGVAYKGGSTVYWSDGDMVDHRYVVKLSALHPEYSKLLRKSLVPDSCGPAPDSGWAQPPF